MERFRCVILAYDLNKKPTHKFSKKSYVECSKIIDSILSTNNTLWGICCIGDIESGECFFKNILGNTYDFSDIVDGDVENVRYEYIQELFDLLQKTNSQC